MFSNVLLRCKNELKPRKSRILNMIRRLLFLPLKPPMDKTSANPLIFLSSINLQPKNEVRLLQTIVQISPMDIYISDIKLTQEKKSYCVWANVNFRTEQRIMISSTLTKISDFTDHMEYTKQFEILWFMSQNMNLALDEKFLLESHEQLWTGTPILHPHPGK